MPRARSTPFSRRSSPARTRPAWCSTKALVSRVQDPGDRRLCNIGRTAAGRKLWARIEDDLTQSDAAVLRTISASERETVVRVIGQLSEAVDEWRAQQSAGA